MAFRPTYNHGDSTMLTPAQEMLTPAQEKKRQAIMAALVRYFPTLGIVLLLTDNSQVEVMSNLSPEEVRKVCATGEGGGDGLSDGNFISTKH